MNDLWEYTPTTDTWKQVTPMPAAGKAGSMCFVAGNNAYIGGGLDSNGNNSKSYFKYIPLADTWQRIKDLDTIGRYGGVAFCLDGKGFVGLGQKDEKTILRDFWQYDTTLDKWTQMTDMDTSYTACGSAAFTIGNNGYIGTGHGPYDVSKYCPLNS